VSTDGSSRVTEAPPPSARAAGEILDLVSQARNG